VLKESVDMITNVRYNSVEEGSVWKFSCCEYVAFTNPTKTEPSTALYGHIIKALKPIFGDVIIAGGCLRDLGYGYAPKDIDVFVNMDTELELELCLDEVIEALEDLKVLGRFTEKSNIFEEKEEGYSPQERTPGIDLGQSCVGVFELCFDNFQAPIQIIAKPLNTEWSGPNIVATFDYNLVQQYIDSEDGEIKGEAGTLKQIAERALYLRKTGDKKTEERLHRFLERTNFEPSNKDENPQMFGKKNANNLAMKKMGSVFVIAD